MTKVPAVAFSHFGIHVTDIVSMESFYTRVVDTPWHTTQPYAEPFDIEAPVETILAETEALCRNRAGFTSRAEWRAAQVSRMGAAG